jgi:hypothetical protein
MPNKRVWLEPGCVRCMRSEDTCPEAFPVSVIRFEEA